ncbi:MAG TPA: glutathione S-transferase family protein, partial [Candidatus Sericytochromatia bacterium]
MGLGLLIGGKWVSEREQEDSQGKFIRPVTTFRNKITADGSSGFKAEAGRYHLYISWACPWAHRTAIMRKLKGLEDVIGMSVVHPEIYENSWEFSSTDSGCIPDTVNNTSALWELYLKADPNYEGRVTVPVLWDKQTNSIVNNESREIIRMLDTEFGFAKSDVDFYPEDLREVIDQTIDTIYQPINNGVYRAGFASTQTAYEEGLTDLFNALDHWDEVLGKQRYLCGDRITEADWCIFTTLLRFDVVYYGHFKCNIRHIWDYPNLWNYFKELYQVPGVKETCNIDHIKRHYYKSHNKINPTRIVPKGPVIDFGTPHNRAQKVA